MNTIEGMLRDLQMDANAQRELGMVKTADSIQKQADAILALLKERDIELERATHYRNEWQIVSAEKAKLVEALQFYANAENWKGQETGIGMIPAEAHDFGATARNFLKSDRRQNVA